MADIFLPVRTRVITVGTGNLFDVAAHYLGDATKWYQISDLNPDLNGDPFYTGIRTLILPNEDKPSNGGIIGR